jgi:undecaprenyl diphosphate synthase
VGLYDRYLAARVRWSDAAPPERVAVVITERDLLERGAYETLESFLDWAFDYRAQHVAVSVSVLDEGAVPTLAREFETVSAPRRMAIRGPDDRSQADAPIQVSIGQGGKAEFAAAVRSLAEDAAAGEIDPENVDADRLEERLVFPWNRIWSSRPVQSASRIS